MDAKEYKRHIERIFSKKVGNSRNWIVEFGETKDVAEFLKICTSKLTVNEISIINLDDMKRVVGHMQAGKVLKKDLENMNADELFDFIVGQERLF